ncbi:uncharacterized protein CLUP02_11409 [Colletotrichum lupini]|uniref:Uncharacterized protein n=1 Tax=Colletotrichum lupini TaxID=145971 RepID=A0A9Q8WKG0_9PEZI|nr:uncharacterized protein CLUP02_11409 [Colletotrichum lupini]UQC85910.1 hypothetical protein CLUP02_11409 [Colletotrichum lupini]
MQEKAVDDRQWVRGGFDAKYAMDFADSSSMGFIEGRTGAIVASSLGPIQQQNRTTTYLTLHSAHPPNVPILNEVVPSQAKNPTAANSDEATYPRHESPQRSPMDPGGSCEKPPVFPHIPIAHVVARKSGCPELPNLRLDSGLRPAFFVIRRNRMLPSRFAYPYLTLCTTS